MSGHRNIGHFVWWNTVSRSPCTIVWSRAGVPWTHVCVCFNIQYLSIMIKGVKDNTEKNLKFQNKLITLPSLTLCRSCHTSVSFKQWKDIESGGSGTSYMYCTVWRPLDICNHHHYLGVMAQLHLFPFEWSKGILPNHAPVSWSSFLHVHLFDPLHPSCQAMRSVNISLSGICVTLIHWMCVCCVTDRVPTVYQPPADQPLLFPAVQLKFTAPLIHSPTKIEPCRVLNCLYGLILLYACSVHYQHQKSNLSILQCIKAVRDRELRWAILIVFLLHDATSSQACRCRIDISVFCKTALNCNFKSLNILCLLRLYVPLKGKRRNNSSLSFSYTITPLDSVS